MKEKYQYSYGLPDPDLIRNWGTKNENKHWFGIAQISLGYQYKISRKIETQFEPFLQIPITGIGHGQVKVWSIGLQLNLNFLVF